MHAYDHTHWEIELKYLLEKPLGGAVASLKETQIGLTAGGYGSSSFRKCLPWRADS